VTHRMMALSGLQKQVRSGNMVATVPMGPWYGVSRRRGEEEQ
jgi:hypothetical protein